MSYLHGPFDFITDVVSNFAVPLPVPQGITNMLPTGVQNVVRGQLKGPAPTSQPVQPQPQIDPSIYQAMPPSMQQPGYMGPASAYAADNTILGMSPAVAAGAALAVVVVGFLGYKAFSK